MRNSIDDEPSPPSGQTNDWTVAIAIAIAIAICVAAFVWIFVELEPFMGDFVGADSPTAPAPLDPSPSTAQP
jgi:hypothetical protein